MLNFFSREWIIILAWPMSKISRNTPNAIWLNGHQNPDLFHTKLSEMKWLEGKSYFLFCNHLFGKFFQLENLNLYFAIFFIFLRHMIATRDIKPGEIIFTEQPISFGPSENTKPVCIGCYSPTITKDSPRCKRCGFPVCSDKCSQIAEHRDYECSVLHKNKYKV